MKLSGKEQKEKIAQAAKYYQKAIATNPNFHHAYNNWGLALSDLAQTLNGKEQQQKFEQAIAKYQKAIDINPDSHHPYNNWGIILSDIAKTQSGKEQQKVFEQACTKYHEAIVIKPDSYEAYSNWTNALLNLAVNLSGKEQQKTYNLAEKKVLQVQKITQKADYNLACVYARTNRQNEAIKQLNACLNDGTLVSIEHLKTDTDMDPLRDRADFKALLKKLK